MADTERLGYSRGILEQLRASHDQLSREELLDLVCHLTKTYVLDATIPYDIPLPERAEELRADPPDAPASPDDDTSDPPEQRFARLIEGLKRRTGLPQLSGFSNEGGRMVLTVDNQRVTFGERVTIEFVPRAGASPSAPTADSPATGRRAPGAPDPEPQPRPPAANSRPNAAPARPAPPPPPKAEEPEDDGYDPSVERFRRLDLD